MEPEKKKNDPAEYSLPGIDRQPLYHIRNRILLVIPNPIANISRFEPP
jgi:hypothetical protein